MAHIRSFCNADLPVLLDLWIHHWSAVGVTPQVDAARLEQAILARSFFKSSHLLLAESSGVPQAWVHFVPSRIDENVALLGAICSLPSSDQSAATELLEAVEQQIAAEGFSRVRAGAVRDDQVGYAGLDPIGHGIGIPSSDLRTTGLLMQSGYEPQPTVVRMVVSTRGYRPPVSREVLQYRRTTRTESTSFQPRDPRQASAMSHLDIEVKRLVAATGGSFAAGGPGDPNARELAQVSLWLSDAEAEVMRPSMAILEISEAHRRGRLEPPESYLIGTVLQTLAEHRVDTVETAVDEASQELVAQLTKLNFQASETGRRWEKRLSVSSAPA